MKCREAVRLMTYGKDSEPAVRFAIGQHAMACSKCRQEFATNSAIKSMLAQYSAALSGDDTEQDVWQETRLIHQVKAKIQTAKESGLGSWELAIISVRGWLFAFAAAAVLLLTLSGQLAVTKTNSTAPPIEDLISNNTQPNSSRDFSNEEAENVR